MTNQREELSNELSRMGDEELVERWLSGNLTDTAVELARAELTKRGITVPAFIRFEPVDEEPEPGDDVSFVTVARSLDPLQIEMLRARLAAEGIAAFAIDRGINQVNPLYSIAVGGVRLMVRRELAEEARRVIELVKSGQLRLRDDDDWK